MAALAVASPGEARAADLSALARDAKPAVVHLAILDASGEVLGNGTGFFISESGWIVTSDHVVARASDVVAKLLDGTVVQILGSLARDPDRDVAILQAAPGDYPTLELELSQPAEEGTEVAVIGSPLGLSWSLSEGIVSAYRKDGLPPHLRGAKAGTSGARLQITASFSPGSSGSPVLSVSTGKVVGVAEAIIVGGESLNFAVPADVVATLRDTIGPNTELQAFSTLPLHNLVASAIFFAVLGAGWLVVRRLLDRKRGHAPTLKLRS